MTTHSMTAGQAAHSASVLDTLVQRIAEIRDTYRARSATRRLCERLETMSDRMLLDIGVSEVDIARLRSGERFVPTHVQM